jgi:hypothetical protein
VYFVMKCLNNEVCLHELSSPEVDKEQFTEGQNQMGTLVPSEMGYQ